ncbi:MAG: PsbP-related protein [Ferruginibacter sp.]
MIRYIALLLLLLPLNSLAQSWKIFNQADILFTAQYPENWVNKIKEGKRVFFTSPSEGKDDDFAENINVSVSTDPSFGTTLKIKEVIQEVIDNVKGSFDSFAEESRTELKWNGFDAFDVTYTGNTKGADPTAVRIMQRLCFYKTRLYLVTYTALKSSDNFAATAKQIINSIKFKP